MCSYLWGYFPRPSQESESLSKSRVCAESLRKMFRLKSTILEGKGALCMKWAGSSWDQGVKIKRVE